MLFSPQFLWVLFSYKYFLVGLKLYKKMIHCNDCLKFSTWLSPSVRTLGLASLGPALAIIPHLKLPFTHSGHPIFHVQNQFQPSSEESDIQGLSLQPSVYPELTVCSYIFLPFKFFLGNQPWTPISLRDWCPAFTFQCHNHGPSAQRTLWPKPESPTWGLTPPSPHHPLEFPLQLLSSLGPLAASYCPSHHQVLQAVFGLLGLPPSQHSPQIYLLSGEPGPDVLSLSSSKNHCSFQSFWFSRPGEGLGNSSQDPWGILIHVAVQGPCFAKQWFGSRPHALWSCPAEVHGPGFQSKQHHVIGMDTETQEPDPTSHSGIEWWPQERVRARFPIDMPNLA